MVLMRRTTQLTSKNDLSRWDWHLTKMDDWKGLLEIKHVLHQTIETSLRENVHCTAKAA